MIKILKKTFSELTIDVNFSALLKENEEESVSEYVPRLNLNIPMYLNMEASGVMDTYCAYNGSRLIGYLLLLTNIVPQYSTLMSSTAGIFVGKEFRKYGAGFKLIHAAEARAKERGSFGLIIGSPIDGVLTEILPRSGYHKNNILYFKQIV